MVVLTAALVEARRIEEHPHEPERRVVGRGGAVGKDVTTVSVLVRVPAKPIHHAH